MTSDDHGSSVAIEDVEDVSHDSSSNSDINQQFEVVFRPDASYRRKSSLVDTDNPKIARHRDSSDRNTACFVHSLLAGDWEPKGHKLEDIEEDRSQPADEPSNDRTHSNEEDHVSTVDYARKQLEEAAPTVVESRQLTKKQLSDMAWNVRKLSKKLGSVKLKLSVKSVFLVTKAHDESLISLTREVCQWLLSKERDRPYIVYVERRLQKHPDFDADGLIRDEPSAAGRLHYWDGELAHDQPHLFDFVITLGGDGTVLYTSWLFQRVVPPVLSFSLGSLGFLTKFDFPHYKETLTSAFRDGIIVSLRLRFECTIMRSKPEIEDKEGKKHVLQNRDLVEELIGEDFEDSVTHTPDKVYEILNDVVLDRGPNPTMSAIELFGDDEHFTTVLADGVCVSTPTGSTAYNLAAGGSLSHPENPVMLVTAICAHTLSFRPIILPDTIVLRMGVPYDARTTSWASFDGRERHELHPGDYVTVSASRYPFANVLPAGRRSEDWIHGISKTLNWNSRQRQKSFKEPHTQP